MKSQQCRKVLKKTGVVLNNGGLPKIEAGDLSVLKDLIENNKLKPVKKYSGYIPPCGIYCGGCPCYDNGQKNSCSGATEGCLNRKCKSIYVCCVEKNGFNYCYECESFPCSRFKKFSESWKKLGEDLIGNQKIIKEQGAECFLKLFNKVE